MFLSVKQRTKPQHKLRSLLSVRVAEVTEPAWGQGAALSSSCVHKAQDSCALLKQLLSPTKAAAGSAWVPKAAVAAYPLPFLGYEQ